MERASHVACRWLHEPSAPVGAGRMEDVLRRRDPRFVVEVDVAADMNDEQRAKNDEAFIQQMTEKLGPTILKRGAM